MQDNSNQLIFKSHYKLLRKWLPAAIIIIIAILFAMYSGYNLATGVGNLCLVTFILANTYLPAKWLRSVFRFKDVAEDFNVFLGYHCLLNIASFFLSCYHCYLTSWVNIWLKIAVVLMGWLVIGGFLLKFKYSATLKKGVYFLHTQQIVFFILLLALLKGHYVF